MLYQISLLFLVATPLTFGGPLEARTPHLLKRNFFCNGVDSERICDSGQTMVPMNPTACDMISGAKRQGEISRPQQGEQCYVCPGEPADSCDVQGSGSGDSGSSSSDAPPPTSSTTSAATGPTDQPSSDSGPPPSDSGSGSGSGHTTSSGSGSGHQEKEQSVSISSDSSQEVLLSCHKKNGSSSSSSNGSKKVLLECTVESSTQSS